MSYLLSIPTCPECGETASAIVNTVTARSIINRHDDGTFDEMGESEIDWASTESAAGSPGTLLVSCDNDHNWQTPFMETA